MMTDPKDVVNKIHNAGEWGAFDRADEILADYTREIRKDAERLAKIEVLEELAKTLAGYESLAELYADIKKQIKVLKAGQDAQN